MMKAMETISGSVQKVLFRDVTTGFAVFVLQPENQKSLVARGSFPSLVAGQEIKITGSWETHPRFGPQFAVKTHYTTIPTSIDGLKKYLGSGLIKGIGESFAEKLVDTFGQNVLNIIDTSPHELYKIPGIGEKRVQSLINSWQEHKALSHIMLFLQEKGLSALTAAKIYKYYRSSTINVLQEQPYRLIDDIWGIGFTTADTIAQKMGIGHTSPHRVEAGILYCLQAATKQGHLYVEYKKLLQEAHKLLEFSHDETHNNILQTSIQTLMKQNVLLRFTEYDLDLIALVTSYEAEYNVAQKLVDLIQTPSSYTRHFQDINQEQLLYQKSNIILNQEQQNAIKSAIQHKVTIITGGPGTGKTTLIKTMLSVLDQHGMTYKLAAPTGRAAKRISESTQHDATTIHRLLEFDPINMTFRHNSAIPIKTDVLIVDEVSMLDIFLAQSLLQAIHSLTHLVLIGDIDQLPPVGPGNFLRDCIASTIIPIIQLHQIFRQAEGSHIAQNAQRIREGKFPYNIAEGDFTVIFESNPEKFMHHVQHIITKEKIRPQDATVLCPMNRGVTGTIQVNNFLQSLFNGTAKPSFFCAGTQLKVDDRVMQLRNNYEKLIFNGDIGIITMIDQASSSFSVSFDGRNVLYSFDDASEITLAYATTVHKSQGSEFPSVIVPIFMQHFTMLKKNLLYTAITRARQKCFIVGEKKALAITLRQTDAHTRTTLLKKLLYQRYSPCVSLSSS